MQANRPTPRKSSKFMDAKIFIAALTLAVTIGFWNLFSGSAYQADKAALPNGVITPPPQPPPDTAQDLPPIPTLVPLVVVDQPVAVQAGKIETASAAPVLPAAPLRSVAVPTVVIVQKNAPVINSGQTASGGGGGGGKSKGVTTTRSSRK